MSDPKDRHWWAKPEFPLWLLALMVGLLCFIGTGFADRLNKAEEQAATAVAERATLKAETAILKEGQQQLLSEVRELNKWLRENHK